ncbi:MAG: FISUMP domain-containing protein, partial [Candidatus Marinimicrobia bacterium]|nr:FISUMP domain-containing protein [Candidatus Neomarinimicrobiota bacterium]
LYFQISDGNNNIENYSGGNVPYDSWTHVSAVLNEKNIKLYVNGQKVSDELFVNNINTTGNSDLTIASMPMSNGTWYFFDGHLDEMGYWNRALTEQEIQNLYTSSTGDILLNGIVSVESNQIKNVADPTDNQDAATKNYVDSKTTEILNGQNFSNNTQIGLTGTVRDNEGNVYETIVMCDGKQWTTSFLNVSKFNNGDPIYNAVSNGEWTDRSSSAWCYYENQDYGIGKLYNWWVVEDSRGIAPEGWHIATEEDWASIAECLGGVSIAGKKVKATFKDSQGSNASWSHNDDGSLNPSNLSGLSILGAGVREGSNGGFFLLNTHVIIWHSTSRDTQPLTQLVYNENNMNFSMTDPYDGAYILLVKD